MKLAVKNLANAEVGSVELNESVFGVPVRADILHRVVNWQRAKARAGTHKTKGISDIAGTTRKPWKQKGTGRARAGSLRAPQMRGGAIIFGPVVRSHAYDLPKKVRTLGLKIALSSKVADGKVIVLDEAKQTNPKTKDLVKAFGAMGLQSVLIIDGSEIDTNFALASRNIRNVDILPVEGANVYDILRHDILVLTKGAITQLEARLGDTAATKAGE